MRIVIALGGSALLRRSDPVTTEAQRRNIQAVAQAIAPLAVEHAIAVVHGNGPQTGLPSSQEARPGPEPYPLGAEPYPLEVLDASTQGVIGYLIEQELRSLLGLDAQVTTVLTMVVVDPADPTFSDPTRFVGPSYAKDDADALARHRGWAFRRDGPAWRRVVPSPEPKRILEVRSINRLLEPGAVVICAGGGMPTAYPSALPGALSGIDAVIDKDLASERLAEDVSADLFVMVTDVDGVYTDWATSRQERLARVTPEHLADYSFAAGSIGPKVDAAIRFVRKTGRRASIGSLDDIAGMVTGGAGTSVVRRIPSAA
jgi:carbamate kinase